MTYREMLYYQEHTMNETLCRPWFGMRSDRERLREALVLLRQQLRRLPGVVQ